MERLTLKYETAVKALNRLKDILSNKKTDIIRDAAIQRFEFTFEAHWKFISQYLREKEGVVENSPKACFRELLSLGKVTSDEATKLLEMTDRRNETSHTYNEDLAEKIYSELPEYRDLMGKVLDLLKDRI